MEISDVIDFFIMPNEKGGALWCRLRGQDAAHVKLLVDSGLLYAGKTNKQQQKEGATGVSFEVIDGEVWAVGLYDADEQVSLAAARVIQSTATCAIEGVISEARRAHHLADVGRRLK